MRAKRWIGVRTTIATSSWPDTPSLLRPLASAPMRKASRNSGTGRQPRRRRRINPPGLRQPHAPAALARVAMRFSTWRSDLRRPRTPATLLQREDDLPESVKVRLKAYEKSTVPLIEFYQRLGLLVTIAALEDWPKRNAARELA